MKVGNMHTVTVLTNYDTSKIKSCSSCNCKKGKVARFTTEQPSEDGSGIEGNETFDSNLCEECYEYLLRDSIDGILERLTEWVELK